jgi:hypothetical protein
VLRGLAPSDSENTEALADSIETQFQPVNDPSSPVDTEVVNQEKHACKYAPASEPILTSLLELQEDIK